MAARRSIAFDKEPTALAMAQTMLGKVEGQDRAALMDYMHTGGQNIDPQTRAWCAAFINSSLQQAGYKGTGSDLARSFLEWGQRVEPGQIQPGDVGVWARGNDPMYGHTGLVKSYDPKTGQVVLVSGNVGAPGQGAVAEQTMDTRTALGFRRATEKAEAMAAAGYSPEQIQKAFLDTIAGPESGGAYDVMYGGKKFTDFSKHPGVYTPIESGPNRGKKSSAAGRYQFLEKTWQDIAGRYRLKDFSPENQDKAAWALAAETYAQQTKGGKLEEALKSGDPARINAAADILKTVWTSMPGGIEQQGYGGKTFADVYGKALGASQAPAPADSPSEGGGRFGGTGLGTPAAAATAAADPWWKRMGKALGGAGATNFGVGGAAPAALPPTPGAAVTQLQPVAPIDPRQQEAQRQQLAMALARLNQGTLWG